jgi:DeoR family transcriptional regulator, aga operon transcriptional repressor
MAFMEGRAQGQSAPAGPVPAEIRQARIATFVGEHGFVRVRDLSERFGVSSVTLRNDLDVLERRGEVERVHGGAMSRRGLHELTFEEAASALGEEKAAIGRRAAALVQHGEAIALDVGTTAMAFARALVARAELTDVTVFTNGLNIALELEPATPRLAVVVCGGTLRPKQHSLVNPLASRFFDQVRVATAFLGCNGLDIDAGVTNSNLPEAEVKRAMVTSARRRVVLVDRTKLGEVAMAPVCSTDEVDVVVTDGGADSRFVEQLRGRGIEVLQAGGAA